MEKKQFLMVNLFQATFGPIQIHRAMGPLAESRLWLIPRQQAWDRARSCKGFVQELKQETKRQSGRWSVLLLPSDSGFLSCNS